MYVVNTIGALGDAAPARTLAAAPSSVNAVAFIGVGAVGLVVGALGFWAASKIGKGRRR